MGILRKVTVKRLSSISEVNGYEEINEIKQLEMKGGGDYYLRINDCCENTVNNMDGGGGGGILNDHLPDSLYAHRDTIYRDTTYVAPSDTTYVAPSDTTYVHNSVKQTNSISVNATSTSAGYTLTGTYEHTWNYSNGSGFSIFVSGSWSSNTGGSVSGGGRYIWK